jgi:hypothetical protein
VSEICDFTSVDQGPVGVACQGKCDNLRALAQFRPEVRHVECAVVAQIDDLYRERQVQRQLQPRSDIGVMVKRGDDDFVTWRERSPERARQCEIDGSHASPEEHLVGAASEEASSGKACIGDDSLRHPTALDRYSYIRGRVLHVLGHCVDDAIWALRPAGSVEESRGSLQCGELLADLSDV